MGVEVGHDEIVTAFRVGKPREVVFAFLATPRNHFTVNREGPIVEQSDGPLRSGSFYVLAFDQFRARVTYEVVEPPERIVVAVALSGRLSGGMRSRRDFVLGEHDDVTSVEVRSRGSGGWISWGPLMRAGERAAMSRLQRKIEG